MISRLRQYEFHGICGTEVTGNTGKTYVKKSLDKKQSVSEAKFLSTFAKTFEGASWSPNSLSGVSRLLLDSKEPPDLRNVMAKPPFELKFPSTFSRNLKGLHG